MSPGRLLVGQIVVVVAVTGGTLWASTQWAAAMLGHAPRLGQPWVRIEGYPVYHPWKLFVWWYHYDAYAPVVFLKAGALAASGGLLGFATAVAGSLIRARQAVRVTTFGSARWATAREIRRAGLLNGDGIVLGLYGGRYLRHDGPEHVMLFAPTRSGKGVGLVVPTLLTWPASMLVHDLKGENHRLTAGWRGTFSRVVVFDPTDINSLRYNPLLEVRRGLNEVRDVQTIADILVDPEGALERRSHWEKTAHALLVGVILHVLYAEPEKTLARVVLFLADPARSFEDALDVMLTTPHLGDRPHPVVAAAARELLNKAENERSGVLSTALSVLTLYRDPVTAAVTGASDWRIADLVHGDKPLSLYLVVPPSDLSRTRPLVRLILNQILRRLTESWETVSARHRLLLMLDEFPALGRLDVFESQLAFLAGYSIRACLIAQSLNQIEKAYGPNNAILDNCHVRMAFATNDERTARRVSEALGTATELKAQQNYTGHRLAPWLAHLMVARQETARPLMTPGEVMQLPAREAIVMIAGLPPIRAQKLRYYQDRNFLERLLPVPQVTGRTEDKVASPWDGLVAPGAERDAAARDAEDDFAPGLALTLEPRPTDLKHLFADEADDHGERDEDRKLSRDTDLTAGGFS
ncbi:MAG: IncP-type conjugal transfer protein TraG [Sphingomonadales bacterium]|nr:IncP-type conjugal transfer protein TraG [Sphingomonadales bacterium]